MLVAAWLEAEVSRKQLACDGHVFQAQAQRWQATDGESGVHGNEDGHGSGVATTVDALGVRSLPFGAASFAAQAGAMGYWPLAVLTCFRGIEHDVTSAQHESNRRSEVREKVWRDVWSDSADRKIDRQTDDEPRTQELPCVCVPWTRHSALGTRGEWTNGAFFSVGGRWASQGHRLHVMCDNNCRPSRIRTHASLAQENASVCARVAHCTVYTSAVSGRATCSLYGRSVRKQRKADTAPCADDRPGRWARQNGIAPAQSDASRPVPSISRNVREGTAGPRPRVRPVPIPHSPSSLPCPPPLSPFCPSFSRPSLDRPYISINSLLIHHPPPRRSLLSAPLQSSPGSPAPSPRPLSHSLIAPNLPKYRDGRLHHPIFWKSRLAFRRLAHTHPRCTFLTAASPCTAHHGATGLDGCPRRDSALWPCSGAEVHEELKMSKGLAMLRP